MRIIPHDEKFYDYFEKCAQQVVRGAVRLDELLRNSTDVQIKTQERKDIEHEGVSLPMTQSRV